MAKKSMVDPDTGYTPEESKAVWAKEWPTWEQICKQREKESAKKSRKLARNPETVGGPKDTSSKSVRSGSGTKRSSKAA